MKKVVIPIKVKKTDGIFFKTLSTAQMDWSLKIGLWGAVGLVGGVLVASKKTGKRSFAGRLMSLARNSLKTATLFMLV